MVMTRVLGNETDFYYLRSRRGGGGPRSILRYVVELDLNFQMLLS